MKSFGSHDEQKTDGHHKVNPVIWRNSSFFDKSTATGRQPERRALRFHDEKVSKNENVCGNIKHDWQKSSMELESWNNMILALRKEKVEKNLQKHQGSRTQSELFPKKLVEEFKKIEKIKREDPWNDPDITQISKEIACKEFIRDMALSQSEKLSSVTQSSKTRESNPKTRSRLYKTQMSRKTKSASCLNDFRRAPEINAKTAGSSNTSRTKIIIRVSSMDERIFKDFLVENEDMLQLRKNIPRLYCVVPDLLPGYLKITYSADAMILLLRHLLSFSFNLGTPKPPWRVILETFSLAKLLNIARLQEMCKEYFSENPLPPANVQEFCNIAQQLGVLRDLEKLLVGLENSTECQSNKRRFQRACTVNVSIYTEPSEFQLPLHVSSPSGKIAMDGVFEKDIKNEILIEAISGQYYITGVQIKLSPTDEDIGKELQIICEASNREENLSWEESRNKVLKSMLIFNFWRRKLLVKAGQVASLNVTIEDLKPRFCCSGREGSYYHKTSCGTFRVTMKSNLKLSDSEEKRFFVEKLFYTTE